MEKIIKHKRHKGAVLPIAFVIVGIMIITTIIVWLLIVTKPEPQATLAQIAAVKVALVSAEKRMVQPYETITGRLQPIKTAQLRFEVSGKMVSRNIEPGVFVTKGTMLMKLDSSDYQDQFQQAKAELIIETKSVSRDKDLLSFAQNNLQLQQQEEQRLVKLVKRNLIAQSVLDSTRQRVFDLQAEVARLEYSVATNTARVSMKQAQHDLAERNLLRTNLTAPFDGVVNEVFFNQGDYVNANDIAVSLVDTSQFDVQLDLRGEVIAGLSLGQIVEVQINNSKYEGEIVALQFDPDIDTNTHQVRVRVANEHAQSGILATVYMPLAVRSNSTVIPVASVVNQFGKSYVFVYEKNLIKKTPVLLGRRIDNEVVVLDGIAEGQKIVARDVNSLQDLQQVITD